MEKWFNQKREHYENPEIDASDFISDAKSINNKLNFTGASNRIKKQ